MTKIGLICLPILLMGVLSAASPTEEVQVPPKNLIKTQNNLIDHGPAASSVHKSYLGSHKFGHHGEQHWRNRQRYLKKLRKYKSKQQANGFDASDDIRLQDLDTGNTQAGSRVQDEDIEARILAKKQQLRKLKSNKPQPQRHPAKDMEKVKERKEKKHLTGYNKKAKTNSKEYKKMKKMFQYKKNKKLMKKYSRKFNNTP